MKKGLILLNMGGPDNLDEVKLFLENMFNDENILSIKNKTLRSLVAKTIIFKRLKHSQENYSKIGGKSPIKKHTLALIRELKAIKKEVYFDFSMRYTPPFSNSVIKTLKSSNIEHLYLFSMYPQYSTTTTKSSIEEFLYSMNKELYFPKKVDIIEHYYDNREYNLAVISKIVASLGNRRAEEFELIISAHGLPQKVIDAGDPYEVQIHENIKKIKLLLKEKNIKFKSLELAYQSKVGPLKWLEPSLEDALKTKKDKKVLIYPISFTIDNSETDFELDIEYREVAKKIGVKEYIVCECLNNSKLFAEAIAKIADI